MAVEYHDFPTVEWTLYFKNTGTADTPILEDIQALDVRLAARPGRRVRPASPRGDSCTPDSYEPLDHDARAGSEAAIRPGRRPPDQRRLALLQRPVGRARA